MSRHGVASRRQVDAATSRQIGSVLGVAVLGAVVENHEARNLANSMANLHVPAALSTRLVGVDVVEYRSS